MFIVSLPFLPTAVALIILFAVAITAIVKLRKRNKPKEFMVREADEYQHYRGI